MKIKTVFFLFIIILFGCIKKEPNKKAASNYLREASLEAEAGNYQKALFLAEQAYKENPTPQIAALKATLLYQLKHFSESLIQFKKIIDDKKTSPQVRADITNNYACNLLCLNRKEEARAVWLQLAKDKNYLSPEAALFNLGLLEFSEAIERKNAKEETQKLQSNIKFANAASYFKHAIEIANNYIDAYFYLALCQEQLQQYEDAKENLITVLGKVPEHKPAEELLMRIDKKIGEFNKKYGTTAQN